MTVIKAITLEKSNQILDKFSRKSFAFKLLVILVLFNLIPLVLVGGLGFSTARTSAIEKGRQTLSAQTSFMAAQFDILLAERLQDIRQLANDAVIRRFSRIWPEPSLEGETSALNLLEDLVLSNPYFQQISLFGIKSVISIFI